MAPSADSGQFFQTESSLEDAARKANKASNTCGDPIPLPSKLLAVLPDPNASGSVYVAESAGNVRRIELETGDKSHVYSGPAAPLTSLAIHGDVLVAGCWDKRIWSWSVSTRAPGQKYHGHGDFVKAVLCARVTGTVLLISGGADAVIIVWDLQSGARLHMLKGHMRGVQALALDPLSASSDEVTVFSAGSDREIRRWRVGADAAAEIEPAAPLVRHETSVYAFRFDGEGELWTASADKTAKCLAREQGWAADTALTHPDFVRDVLVCEATGAVVTACRDEEVRVWDQGTGSLQHTFSGHYEEVTALALVDTFTVVSISIDGTLRRWSLHPEALKAAKAAAAAAEANQDGTSDGLHQADGQKTSLLTADEERELAELMDDDEDDD